MIAEMDENLYEALSVDSDDEPPAKVWCTCCYHSMDYPLYQIFQHELLHVAMCKICDEKLPKLKKKIEESGGGDFSEYCSWCLECEGGELLLCDGTDPQGKECPHVFCIDCVGRNLGDRTLARIQAADSWRCFVCDPSQVEHLVVSAEQAKDNSIFSEDPDVMDRFVRQFPFANCETQEDRAACVVDGVDLYYDVFRLRLHNKETARCLDGRKDIAKLESTIRQEFASAEPTWTPAQIEQETQEMLQVKYQLWTFHDNLIAMQEQEIGEFLSLHGFSWLSLPEYQYPSADDNHIFSNSESNVYTMDPKVLREQHVVQLDDDLPDAITTNGSAAEEIAEHDNGNYGFDEQENPRLAELTQIANADPIVQKYSQQTLQSGLYPPCFEKAVPAIVLNALSCAKSKASHKDRERLVTAYGVPQHIAIIMTFVEREFPGYLEDQREVELVAEHYGLSEIDDIHDCGAAEDLINMNINHRANYPSFHEGNKQRVYLDDIEEALSEEEKSSWMTVKQRQMIKNTLFDKHDETVEVKETWQAVIRSKTRMLPRKRTSKKQPIHSGHQLPFFPASDASAKPFKPAKVREVNQLIKQGKLQRLKAMAASHCSPVHSLSSKDPATHMCIDSEDAGNPSDGDECASSVSTFCSDFDYDEFSLVTGGEALNDGKDQRFPEELYVGLDECWCKLTLIDEGVDVVHSLFKKQEPTADENKLSVYLFGRSTSKCSIVTPADRLKISNRHARIYFAKVSTSCHLRVLFADCSRNGTYLNGVKVPRGQPVCLKHGDLLSLGGTGCINPSNGLDGPTREIPDFASYRVTICGERVQPHGLVDADMQILTSPQRLLYARPPQYRREMADVWAEFLDESGASLLKFTLKSAASWLTCKPSSNVNNNEPVVSVDEFYVHTIGRAKNCDLSASFANIKTVSNEHCMIYCMREVVNGEELWAPFIKDLSRHGTYVNDKKIVKGRPLALLNGDIIDLFNPMSPDRLALQFIPQGPGVLIDCIEITSSDDDDFGGTPRKLEGPTVTHNALITSSANNGAKKRSATLLDRKLKKPKTLTDSRGSNGSSDNSGSGRGPNSDSKREGTGGGKLSTDFVDLTYDSWNDISASDSSDESVDHEKYMQTLAPIFRKKNPINAITGNTGSANKGNNRPGVVASSGSIAAAHSKKKSNLSEETRRVLKDERKRIREIDAFKHFADGEGMFTVNSDRPPGDDAVTLVSSIATTLMDHQKEAVQFMWQNSIISLQNLSQPASTGSGCLLAHCMGLGKTLSVIALVVTLLTNPVITGLTVVSSARMPSVESQESQESVVEARRIIHTILIVVPNITVTNWESEFRKFTPADLSPLVNVKSIISENEGSIEQRVHVLRLWYNEGGVLIMPYSMFLILARGSKKAPNGDASRRRSTSKNANDFTRLQEVSSAEDAFFAEARTYVISPDLVIADEAHTIKNKNTETSKLMKEICTKRRIALTGSPLQNNLQEYWCMIDWVKERFLGTGKEFKKAYVSPIKAGETKDATRDQVRTMKRRVTMLHKRLLPIVHRRDFSVLDTLLANKREFVITVKMTDFQVCLYKRFMECLMLARARNTTVKRGSMTFMFAAYQGLLRIWNHPGTMVLHSVNVDNAGRKGRPAIMDMVTSKTLIKMISPVYQSFLLAPVVPVIPIAGGTSDEAMATDDADSMDDIDSVGTADTDAHEGLIDNDLGEDKGDEDEQQVDAVTPHDWWRQMVVSDADSTLLSPADFISLGAKIRMFLSILAGSVNVGDKVLLFSQSVKALDLIEMVLNTSWGDSVGAKPIAEGAPFAGWILNRHYSRIDGSVSSMSHRQKLIDNFNKSERLKLFMLTTKTGGLGINLQSANRVVILDSSWNPVHDLQAIFRSYRFGQKKPVFTYRLLAANTMEEKIYQLQVSKQAMANRVVDAQMPLNRFNTSDLKAFMNYNDEDREELDWENIAERLRSGLVDSVLMETVEAMKDEVVDFVDHEALLADLEEEHLNADELEVAEQEEIIMRSGHRVPISIAPPVAVPSNADLSVVAPLEAMEVTAGADGPSAVLQLPPMMRSLLPALPNSRAPAQLTRPLLEAVRAVAPSLLAMDAHRLQSRIPPLPPPPLLPAAVVSNNESIAVGGKKRSSEELQSSRNDIVSPIATRKASVIEFNKINPTNMMPFPPSSDRGPM